MLSGQQNSRFRPMVGRAWLAVCARTGARPNDRAAKEKWYRKELLSGPGFYSTKQIGSVEQFDGLCLHFAVIGGNQGEIDYWSKAAERRALWRLRESLRAAGKSEAYALGVARNMGYGDLPLEEMPAEAVLKVNTAIYMQWKRQAKKAERETALAG